jgi:tetratricopeptide (TPR) repeat protein
LKTIIKIAITFSFSFVLLTLNTIAQGLGPVKSAIDAQQYEKATLLVKQHLKGNTNNGDANFYLGKIHLEVNQPDSAQAVFTKGASEFKKNPLNFIGLGKLELMTGNAVAAKNYFDMALKVAKRKDFLPQLYISQAYISSIKPDLTLALFHLKKAYEIDKKHTSTEILTSFGDYYAKLKNNTEAFKSYSRALSLGPEAIRAKVQIGRLYMDAAEFNKADSSLKALTVKYPAYGPAFEALSALHEAWAGDHENNQNHAVLAAGYYKNFLAITGSYYSFRLKYAELLYLAKDFAKLNAELLYLQSSAFQIHNDVKVDRLSAYTAFEHEKFNEALQHFDKYLTNIKDHSLIISDDYLYLGRTQLKLGQEEKGVYNISKAVELDRNKASFLAEIGRFYYDKKNWSKAIEFYQKLSSLAQTSTLPVVEDNLYYATALFFKFVADRDKGGNPSKELLMKADQLFKGINVKSPNNASAYLWSGRVLYLLDEFSGSQGAMITPYETYIRIQEASSAPQTVGIRKSLVESYNVIAGFAATRNEMDKARAYWKRSLVLDPENTAALAGIKSLGAKAKRR